MKIYTRKGDDGTTGLLYGGRVRKDGPAPTAYGAVDEAQAALGVARAECRARAASSTDAPGAHRARPLGPDGRAGHRPRQPREADAGQSRVTADMVARLERPSTTSSARFEPPTEFVVPGETVSPPARRGPHRRAPGRARTRSSAAADGLVRRGLPQPPVRPAVDDGPLAGGNLVAHSGGLVISFELARAVPDGVDLVVEGVTAGSVPDDPMRARRAGFEGALGKTVMLPGRLLVGLGENGSERSRRPCLAQGGRGRGTRRRRRCRAHRDHVAGDAGRGRGLRARRVPVHEVPLRPEAESDRVGDRGRRRRPARARPRSSGARASPRPSHVARDLVNEPGGALTAARVRGRDPGAGEAVGSRP